MQSKPIFDSDTDATAAAGAAAACAAACFYHRVYGDFDKAAAAQQF